MNTSTETAAAAETKRKAKIIRTIKFADGSEGPRLKTGLAPVSFTLKWAPTGEEIVTDLSAVPEASKVNALTFGLITNFTNAAGGKDAQFQDLLDRREIVMSGEWAEAAGEGGPSPTMLAEAVHRVYAATGGKMNDGSEATLEAVTAKVKTWNADTRKQVKADPRVAAAYAEIELERAKERAKKAKAAAKEASPETDGLAGLL